MALSLCIHDVMILCGYDVLPPVQIDRMQPMRQLLIGARLDQCAADVTTLYNKLHAARLTQRYCPLLDLAR